MDEALHRQLPHNLSRSEYIALYLITINPTVSYKKCLKLHP